MKTSDKTDVIAPALLSAQKAMPALKRTGENAHFKSTYVTLDTLLATVRPVLSKYDIVLLQSTEDADDAGMTVTTRLLHASGQWVESGIRLPLAAPSPQAAGSASSYGRRYSLEAILGLTGSEDDDGNTATVHQALQPAATSVQRKPDTLGGRHVTVTEGTTTTTPPCPLCNGSMWSNLEKKASGQFKASSPDYRCRDKNCKGVIWPDKGAKVPAVPVGPAFDDIPEGLVDDDRDSSLPF